MTPNRYFNASVVGDNVTNVYMAWLDGRAAKSNPLLEATNALAKVTGRQPESPDWSHDGAILGGQDFVEEVVQNDLSANMPLMSVWLQNWPGTRLQTGAYGVSLHRLWWNWEPDMTLYPTWARWVPHLQSTYGVRTMSYINTFLTNVSTKSTGYNTSFYEIAVSEGRFVANAQPAMVSTIDWLKKLVKKQYYSVPISGMMQDCAYPVVSDTIDPRVFHNDYPTLWATLLRDVMTELGFQNDTIAAPAPFQPNTRTCSGLVTRTLTNISDGMRAVISSTLHVGFGTHSDIGGYTNTSATVGSITRNTALLGRWGELGAFSGTAFRTHEGNIPQMNAQAFNARLFRSLNPYRLPLLDEYQMNDWPLVRHPMVYSSNDSVARAVIAGWARLSSSVEVYMYLPLLQVDSQGTTVNSTAFAYKHLWSGEEFAPGQTVRVDASWGKPGVFMRWPVTEKEGLQLQQLWEFGVAENATALLTEA
ncbi:putative alpha-glucosidase protein [Phytophthora infestans]|uniref:Putative alpha-glucosidase protein n=1 Tax=Phytophthora infestans TaxID=4787 RepID=A0A833T6I2_PHYIN|nr:putative alpha-glucosidase protein [Phytophthora infestans]